MHVDVLDITSTAQPTTTETTLPTTVTTTGTHSPSSGTSTYTSTTPPGENGANPTVSSEMGIWVTTPTPEGYPVANIGNLCSFFPCRHLTQNKKTLNTHFN